MKRLILGCGFLGQPTAVNWAQSGDSVYAVTRKSKIDARFTEFQTLGITPITADVTDPASLDRLPHADTVLIAVGMDRSVYSDVRTVYVDGLKNVLQSLSDETGHLIYVSSTGVYGDSGGDWVDETTTPNPLRPGGKACLEAEQLIQSSRFADRATILRFAGLYGNSRIPMRETISNRQWENLNPTGFLNLIHVADGARIIQQFAGNSESVPSKNRMAQTFLISDGQPPIRKQYYDVVAEFTGTGPIPWAASDINLHESNRTSRSDKRISNQKLINEMDYQFQFPDFRSGLKQCFEHQNFE